jgi:hypothetical protein
VIENLAGDILEMTAHESRDLGSGPPAQPEFAQAEPGPVRRSPRGACPEPAERARKNTLAVVEPFEPFQLLDAEAEIPQGVQVVGTLRAMVDVDGDGRRDPDLHGRHQQAREKGLDPRAGNLLIQAVEVQTQNVDDVPLHLGSPTLRLAASPCDGLFHTIDLLPTNQTPPDMTDDGFRHTRSLFRHQAIIPLHRSPMQALLS